MSRIEAKLAELGLELPRPPVPIANFVPFTVTGNLVFLAGQVNEWNGTVPFVGKLGEVFDVEAGIKAARLFALNPSPASSSRATAISIGCGGASAWAGS